MPTLFTMTTMYSVSGFEGSAATNTLWFQTAVSTTPYSDIVDAIEDAYDNLYGIFSPAVAIGGHVTKIYDLADDEPRAPVYERTWALSSAPSGTTLPMETAMCLSFQGPRVSGVKQASRRGRIYLGPFDTTAIGSDGRPSTSCINNVLAFGSTLLDASNAATDWFWVVRSRVNSTNVTVEEVWVDNEFDTQRRRSLDTATKTVYP